MGEREKCDKSDGWRRELKIHGIYFLLKELTRFADVVPKLTRRRRRRWHFIRLRWSVIFY
jgi:hypothetical protein